MKNLEKPIYMVITPQIDTTNDSLAFKWGILNNPQMLSNNNDGQTVFFPATSTTDPNAINIQLMRLFTVAITRGLIENTGKVDQNVVHEIDFKLPSDMTKFIGDVLNELQNTLAKEIKYQNDPVKPTKTKLESLSLTK